MVSPQDLESIIVAKNALVVRSIEERNFSLGKDVVDSAMNDYNLFRSHGLYNHNLKYMIVLSYVKLATEETIDELKSSYEKSISVGFSRPYINDDFEKTLGNKISDFVNKHDLEFGLSSMYKNRLPVHDAMMQTLERNNAPEYIKSDFSDTYKFISAFHNYLGTFKPHNPTILSEEDKDILEKHKVKVNEPIISLPDFT